MKKLTIFLFLFALELGAVLAYTVYKIKNEYILEYRDASYVCRKLSPTEEIK